MVTRRVKATSVTADQMNMFIASSKSRGTSVTVKSNIYVVRSVLSHQRTETIESKFYCGRWEGIGHSNTSSTKPQKLAYVETAT